MRNFHPSSLNCVVSIYRLPTHPSALFPLPPLCSFPLPFHPSLLPSFQCLAGEKTRRSGEDEEKMRGGWGDTGHTLSFSAQAVNVIEVPVILLPILPLILPLIPPLTFPLTFSRSFSLSFLPLLSPHSPSHSLSHYPPHSPFYSLPIIPSLLPLYYSLPSPPLLFSLLFLSLYSSVSS